MNGYSRGEIDRLGSRLRKVTRPSAEDVSLYVEWSRGHVAALSEVDLELDTRIKRVQRTGTFARSSRIKQISSVAAKLRRLQTKLSGLEDIAGYRVVVPSPDDVDRLLVECVTLHISRFRDYRVQPNNGYRALHIIVRAVDGKPVELQLRTRVQQAWADLTERFASEVDLELKYGGGPVQSRRLLDQFSVWGGHVDMSRRRFSVAQAYASAEEAMREIRVDTLAAPVTIEVPPGRRGDLLIEEVARFVNLCDGLYPSRGNEG